MSKAKPARDRKKPLDARGLLDGGDGQDPERRFRLRRLTDAARAFTYASRREEVARLAVSQAAGLLEAPRALLALEDGDGRLRVEAVHGMAEQDMRAWQDNDGDLLVGALATFVREAGERFLGVPLVARGRVIGLLAVMAPAGEPYAEQDEWALSALADHAAAALELDRLDADVRVRLEERLSGLEAMAEQRQRSLAILAHDLRAPLNAIVAFTEAMQMQAFGPLTERQRDALHRIRVSTQHITGVTANLLDAALLSSGSAVVELQPVDCRQVLDEAALMVRPEATARDQPLELEPGEAPQAQADPDRLRQVVVNLLENAVKYTPVGGRITARTTTRGSGAEQQVLIEVQDTGPGVPPDQAEAIFEPYHRAADVGDTPGVGLGLSISRGLARQMQGEIEVRDGPDGGCVFTVVLRPTEADAGE